MKGDTKLLMAFLAGPAAATFDLGASYPLVYASHDKRAMFVVAGVCFVLCLLGIALARSGRTPARRFVADLGALLDAICALFVMALAIPVALHGLGD